jgi:hypothetical protein
VGLRGMYTFNQKTHVRVSQVNESYLEGQSVCSFNQRDFTKWPCKGQANTLDWESSSFIILPLGALRPREFQVMIIDFTPPKLSVLDIPSAYARPADPAGLRSSGTEISAAQAVRLRRMPAFACLLRRI